MFTKKSQIVGAYCELTLALNIITGVRAKRNVMESIDPATWKGLCDVMEALLDWQEELSKAIGTSE